MLVNFLHLLKEYRMVEFISNLYISARSQRTNSRKAYKAATPQQLSLLPCFLPESALREALRA